MLQKSLVQAQLLYVNPTYIFSIFLIGVFDVFTFECESYMHFFNILILLFLMFTYSIVDNFQNKFEFHIQVWASRFFLGKALNGIASIFEWLD